MSEQRTDRGQVLNRRAFLQGGTLLLAGSALSPSRLLAVAEEKPTLRLGLVTDLHHAEKDAHDTRFYRESLHKFSEAAARFREDRPDLVVCLGDLIDSAPSLDEEKGYLRRIVREFAAVPAGTSCWEITASPT